MLQQFKANFGALYTCLVHRQHWGLVLSKTCCFSMSCFCYEHDVSPSVRLSVCDIGGLCTWNEKWKWATAGGRCLGYMHAEADPVRSFMSRDPEYYTEEDQWVLKMWSFAFRRHIERLACRTVSASAASSYFICVLNKLRDHSLRPQLGPCVVDRQAYDTLHGQIVTAYNRVTSWLFS